MECWDGQDGEKFRLSNIAWDGHRLTGNFYMPSTKHMTYSSLKFTSPDRLVGPYGGDAVGQGEEVWTRKQ